jgi:hypothetical protein
MAEELHKNPKDFDKFYDSFIQICEKYPSEIRKIQEKEQISLKIGSKNMYKYEPFYYVLYFFLDKFNNNKKQKIIDIHNTNNNNRKMNHLLEKMNRANTSNTKKFKTFFMTNKRNEFLDIVKNKLEKFNAYKYKQIEDIEKKLEKLKKLLEKLNIFQGKIQNSNSLKNRLAKIYESLFKVFSNKISELVFRNEYIYQDYLFQQERGYLGYAELEINRFLELDLEKLYNLLNSLVKLFEDKITFNKNNFDKLFKKIEEQKIIKRDLKEKYDIIKLLDYAENQIELLKSQFKLKNIDLKNIDTKLYDLRELLKKLNSLKELKLLKESKFRKRLDNIYVSIINFFKNQNSELKIKIVQSKEKVQSKEINLGNPNYNTDHLKIDYKKLKIIREFLDNLIKYLKNNTSKNNSFNNVNQNN